QRAAHAAGAVRPRSRPRRLRAPRARRAPRGRGDRRAARRSAQGRRCVAGRAESGLHRAARRLAQLPGARLPRERAAGAARRHGERRVPRPARPRRRVARTSPLRRLRNFPRFPGEWMYCSRCGTQNENASKFCRSCGLDLTATTPVGAVKDPQQEMTDLELVREQLKEEYEILEELGRGGMAIVFRARERQLERDVAIKVLPFSLSFDKEFVERFQREARTSAKLEHPNIIPIYRVGKSGRVISFVMKSLRGKPLASVLAARGSLPPGEIRQVLVQVGRALAYAHKSGIVHRDIKPDNIMFDEHAQAVVTDFGIAKAATGGKLTGTGMSI